MKRLAVALFILLPSLWCRAQSFTTINYSIPEGLPSSEVYEIFQDRHGFLWFATDNGVVKFDGSEMQKFSIAEGLTDPVVFGFHEDLKGRLWFRTFSGRLCYLEDEKIHPYRYNDSLAKHISASVVHSLYVDSLEQLWFSCYRDRGVWGKIDRHGNVEKSYCDNFQIFYKDFGDTYLSGYSNRDSLSHISINGKVFPYIPSNPNCAQLQVLAVTWKGKNYISFCKDLFEYDDRQMKHVMSYDWPIVSLSKDNDDNLWIGFLNDGVRRFTNNDFKDAWSPAFLRNFSVTRVLHDNENGLWFGTLEQGIFYIPNVSIKNYSIDPSQKILMVSKLKKEMLVGTNNGLIISFNEQGEQKKTRSYPAPLNGFYADSYDRVWISDKSGTFRTDAKFKITKRFANMAFFNFTQGTDGTVWTISSRYVSKIDRHDSLSTFRTDFIYRTLLEENSQILLATRNGLHIYDRNMKFVREIKELANHKISKITGLRDSLYLITTVGSGFILFNMNGLRYQQFKSVANNVYASLVTEESLWLGTEKGLVKINMASLFAGRPKVEIISKQHGLVSNQISHLLYMKPNIWAFSGKGFSIINENETGVLNIKPRFYIKEVSANKQSLNLDADIDIPYDKNNIHLAFGFVSFSQQHIFVRYRLHQDDPWIESQDRNLEFYSLAPATYQFEIQYSLDNIYWTPAYTSPFITILPPLWQTWYFQTIVAFVVLLIIFLFFVNQVRVYKKHQRKLIQSEIEAIEQERSRIAKDLHDSVGTDFTAIKMIVTQLLNKYSEPKTDEVETQFQSTIHEIKNIIYGLSPPGLERYGLFSGLKNYIDKLNGTVPVKIEFNTFGDDIKDVKLSIPVFRILQELISNSLKHSNAKTITLHMNSFKDLLNIVYEDNGIGFSWENNIKGLGLYNIESRVQSVGGTLKFDSGSFGISYTLDIPLKRKADMKVQHSQSGV